ncbi:MAG: aminotransferase class V-fold PLP-dependent enzyme [Bryobacteraceae bacterium]|nr:aminotransferase class V-fold PLP-dependent enzyme [Bryobacteraceae bacterium]
MSQDSLRNRRAPLAIAPGEFRKLGHQLVDRIAEHLDALADGPVTRAASPADIRALLGADRPLPRDGADPDALLREITELLFSHSLFNGHPRFWGYVTSSPAPIGMLGDLLASAVNPNVGAWILSPVATELEAQTVRWIAELIGYPEDCGGLLVSGGNMANFVGFLAARAAKAGWNVREAGMAAGGARRLRVYASTGVHTWVQKAVDLFGLGTDSIRWIDVDRRQRLDLAALRKQVEADRAQGDEPFLVVGTAGSVSTGAVDPLPEIAAFCREAGAWFHVDGAYGALAAAVPGAPADLGGMSQADSVAVDPHKWLYAPLEAGCSLVRRTDLLRNAFSYHPPYYHFDQEAINFFDMGPQNSRGFRALKVWLGLRQAGRDGYLRMIGDDILLARRLRDSISNFADLEPVTQELSITTFRYVPCDLRASAGSEVVAAYLNWLNQELLTRLERSGEAFLSNAMVDGTYVLRMCIVNFRTTLADIEALPDLVIRLGRDLDAVSRPLRLPSP